MRRIRITEEPRYRNSGWVSALFLTLAFIGWQFPADTEPPARDCSPIFADDYPTARQTLIERGYTERADGTLIPRGCDQ